jgi:hypothetical protein
MLEALEEFALSAGPRGPLRRQSARTGRPRIREHRAIRFHSLRFFGTSPAFLASGGRARLEHERLWRASGAKVGKYPFRTLRHMTQEQFTNLAAMAAAGLAPITLTTPFARSAGIQDQVRY